MFSAAQGAGGVTSASDTKGQATQVGQGNEVRHELVDGDYQIIIHVIEARDLKPVDTENGTADPVVLAKLEFPSSVVPSYQNTDRKVNTLNPVWDYTMIFRQTGLPASEAKMGILSIMVKDANITARDVMIGQFDFNLSMIYSRKNHEYFQQWCALMDPTGESEEQQGYLRVNVTCLINNDEMASHKDGEATEEKFNLEYGVTEFRDVLMPPHVIQGKSVVCAEIIRGDGMVPLDLSAAIGLGGIDPYVQLQFGNNEPVKSSYISGSREPVWQQQLEVPVVWPTMVDMVTLSVWDHDMIGTDDAVGAIRFSFNALMSTVPGTSGPPVIRDFFANWVNLYGAPPEADYTSGVGSALVAYAMNHGGRPGTFFRGRLLMRMWKRIDLGAERRSYDLPIDGTVTTVYKDVVTETKSDDLRKFVAEKKETRRFDDMDLGEIAYKEITESRYTLRCDLYEASDMSLDDSGFFGKGVQIQIRVGKIEANSKSQDVYDGRALFNEAMDDLELMFPEIKEASPGTGGPQFPDIFIYLLRGGKHIAYLRWTAVELLDISKKKINGKDFMPKWLPFVEEPCLDAFAPGDSPGFLLCSLTLGKEDLMTKAGRGGKLVERQEQNYEMRFHLYMARFLPAKDENGLCDPYVVVKYYGQTLKSSVKDATCNPSWYETIVADVVVPEPLELAPPITVLLYDQDKILKDDLIGRFYLPLTKAMLVGGSSPPTPEWHKLMFEQAGDVSGECLATMTMVPAGKKDSSPPPNLLPETVDASVEFTVVGLRDMQALPMMGALGDALGLGNMGIPLCSPYIEMDMGDAATRQTTKVSSYPSANDPNYLETYTVQMKMPKNELFSPTMTLRVRDVRTMPGGYVLGKPLVATGTIALADKMPWGKNFKVIESPISQHAMEERATDSASQRTAAKKKSKSLAAKALAASKAMVQKIGDFLDDGEINTPKYMIGRKTIDNELEDTYKYPNPIMEFPLFRGCDGILSREMPCGKFKGYVRIMQKDVPPPPLPMDMSELFIETRVMVRLYLLRAYNLPPMDLNGSTDSYPEIELAGKTVSDIESKVELNLNPNYYSSYELYATIPGAANLKVSIFDADRIGARDFVGSTSIDLENRWFNSEWRDMELKPVEMRTLHTPTSAMSQGKVEMWVEMMTPAEGREIPMFDIKPPPPEEFELRVIVWKTDDVPMKTKDGESKVDMKVKVNFIGYESVQSEQGIGGNNNRWDYAQSYGEMMGMMTKNIERMGDLAQDKLKLMQNAAGVSANPGNEKETDVHYWVTDGKGLFNHRMIWPLLYNIDNLEDKPMRLQIKVYDWDVGKDDLIGETQLNIDDMLKAAFKNRERNRFMQIGQPFRIAEGAARGWKLEFPLKKDNHEQGNITVSIVVYDHMVALLKPAGEGRSEPNQNPALPEPLRRMPWDENQTISSRVGCCGGEGGQGNIAA
jgi:hypothetical protein